MSSFYGQMRWQDFQRFFYNFTLRNQEYPNGNMFNENPEKDDESTVKANEILYVQPNEDFATMQINAANHWLKIAPRDSVGDEFTTYTGFSIFHNKPAITDLDMVNVFEVSAIPENKTATILKSGDSFKVVSIGFDKAGHFSKEESLEPTYFQLPPQIIRVNQTTDLTLNDDQKFHFINKDGLINLNVSVNGKELTFEHKSNFTNLDNLSIGFFKFEGPQDGTEQYTVERSLEPGDFISTYNAVYDQAGHAVAFTKVYYQLPVSEVDERLKVLQEAVDAINLKLETIETSVNDHDLKITEYAKRLSDIDILLQDDSQRMQPAIQVLASNLTGYDPNRIYSIPEGIATISDYLKIHLEGYTLQGFHGRITAIELFLEKKYPGEFEAVRT